jgi:branched-chain amino acid transport system substrate-binding protein
MEMRMSKSFGILVIAALMVVLAAGSVSPAMAKGEPIKIGFIGALASPYGASNKAVLEISVDEINAAGGILGRPVKLITEDWKRQVPLAVAAYKKLVMTDRCTLVFTEGTEGSTACAQVASQLFPDYPHLQFAIWTAHEGLTDPVANQYDKYKFLFRPYPNTADYFDDSAGFSEFLTDVIGAKKLALIIEDVGYTEPLRKGLPGRHSTLQEYLKGKGINIVYYAINAIDEKMFLPIFEKIAASGADAIYWVTGYTDTVTLTKQWITSAAKDLNLVLNGGAVSYAAFYNMTGGAALGVAALWPEVQIPFTDKSLPFFKKLKAKKAGMLASTPGAYDGPWILKAGAEKAGTVEDVNALIKALEKVEVQHGFWKWKFDKRHEPIKGFPYHPMIFAQFREDGRYVVIFQEGIRKIANPNDRYLPVVERRKRAGQ